MTYKIMATRDDLKSFNLPCEEKGTLFEVVITPIEQADADRIAFRNLKGIAGRKLDLQTIREERFSETLD